tara:strand:+ start:619 stop:1401 length:783 start_codon:yes stop_codon:yes gene_type:complete
MEKETSTDVVKKEKGGALAASIFESDAAAGLSNIGHDDLALPFLKILGQLSPETNKRDGKYVEGAEPGMIYNSVTGELFDGEKGIKVIPCHYKLEYIEWQDRGTGPSAPVNIYPSSSDILSKTTRGGDYKDRLPSGNYVEKTASHFIIVAEKNPSTALIAMKSTQLKVSRKWNSMMQSIKLKGKNGLFTPASFSHIYNLRSVQQSNDKGTWFGWDIAKVGMVEDTSLYQQAKKFYESVSKGDIQVKHGSDSNSAKTDDHM